MVILLLEFKYIRILDVSTSLIVLFSENRKCAAFNAGIYIFLMFFITTAHQSLQIYQSGVTQFNSLSELAVNHIGGWLLYSIPPALVCACWELFYGPEEKFSMGKNTSITASSIYADRNSYSFLLGIYL